MCDVFELLTNYMILNLMAGCILDHYFHVSVTLYVFLMMSLNSYSYSAGCCFCVILHSSCGLVRNGFVKCKSCCELISFRVFPGHSFTLSLL
jgi:hypothetical protein